MREMRGFSQEALAHKLGINQSTYSKLEKDTENLSLGRLMKIAEVLDADLADIMEIGQTPIFNNQQNQGNGYVETINNDFRDLMQELKSVYEKLLAAKDEQIEMLKEFLAKKI